MKDHHRDSLVCSIIAAGCGMIMSAALFGPWKPVAQILTESWCYGWAAAIATAAVGFGAFRYAREAHLLRTAEVYDSRQRQYRLDLAAFNEWRDRIVSIHATGEVYERTKETGCDLDNAPMRVYRSLVRTFVTSISPNGVTTTHFALEPDMLAPIFALNATSLYFRECCIDFLERYSSLDVEALPPEGVRRAFSSLTEMATESTNDAKKALDVIRKLHPVYT